MASRAVLFDVGGPLNTQETYERLVDQDIRDGLAAAGYQVGDDDYQRAWRWAIETFAPNPYQSVIWLLTSRNVHAARDIYRVVASRAPLHDAFELRPGMVELIRRLSRRAVRLGLAANDPQTSLAALDAFGIGRYFRPRGGWGRTGLRLHESPSPSRSQEGPPLRKPDVRVFSQAAERLKVAPQECVMVGDRIDDDIVPAKSLGMRTILFRTGRHAAQQPRSWEEMPDAEVHDVGELATEIGRLFSPPRGIQVVQQGEPPRISLSHPAGP